MHRDHVPARQIAMYPNAFSQRAYNSLHDFGFFGHQTNLLRKTHGEVYESNSRSLQV
jgi:hypothetical protein